MLTEQIPVYKVHDFLHSNDAPAGFRSALGDSGTGRAVVRFTDPADHSRNRERASALLSTLGRLVCAYPTDGLWSDLSVKLDADPQRTHGTGENPFHMDLVDRQGAPRYIALYCERNDPAGGGASQLSDVWSALSDLDEKSRAILEQPIYSYFADSGVYGVGSHLERFAVVPSEVRAGVPVRFTSKMLPHLERSELIASGSVRSEEAAAAFSKLVEAVSRRAVAHLLQPGEMLVFDQYRHAHARSPLGAQQESVPVEERRLLKQTYVGPGA